MLVLGVLCGRPAPGWAQGTTPDPIADEADDTGVAATAPDPLETLNRFTFRLNTKLDRWVFDPVTRAYVVVVPRPARLAVRRVLANLNEPVVFVNDLLQLEPGDAAVTVARFAVNTTAGVAGIFDVAARGGLTGHQSDFGQTLALCGVPSGPYLIFPVAGPTTARDGVGYVVDFLFRPYTYFLGPGVLLFASPIHEGSVGISVREEHAAELHALEASSMDFYVALRSAYTQDRTARIWARRENRGPLALAKRALAALAPGSSGGEVGEAGPHGGDQGFETLTLQH